MDPITHGITGALLGKAYFSKREARVAIFAATLGAVFPDIDVFYEAYAELAHHDPLAIVRYHRAITHSLVALPFFALLLALIIRWFARRLKVKSPSTWMLTVICGVGIASHILLDGTTSFGTRIWYPLSSRRVAWDWVFIIDFVFISIVTIPHIIAWIYHDSPQSREKSRKRASLTWIALSVCAVGVWALARALDVPFHLWIAALASLIFALILFSPAWNSWGFRVGRSAWCQAGVYTLVAYVIACVLAHNTAMRRVQEFAAVNHIEVDRIAALPVPPSMLDWGDEIRTSNGVYQSQYDLRQSQPAPFHFTADSPMDDFTRRALQLPQVQLYWTFARFPVMKSYAANGEHFVEFTEDRYVNGRSGERSPFTYLVVFDSSGKVLEQGFQTNAMSIRDIQPMPPEAPDDTAP